MKELSIEEKAKRYDDRLEKARKWYNANTNEGYKGIFEDIFPELKESEDERIRKEIMKFIFNYPQKLINRDSWLDWLEKQGEQKFLDDIVKEVTKDKDAAISFLKSTGIINENGELADEYKIEQDEQKSEEVDNLHNYLYGEQESSEWSEEDEKVLHAIRNALNYEKPRNYLKSRDFEFTDILDWLKSLKDRVQTKPKQKWSEEDEIAFGDALWCCKQAASIAKDENEMGNAWYAERWLKSLKERYTWKPSKEQISVVARLRHCLLEDVRGNDVVILDNLLEQLKAL